MNSNWDKDKGGRTEWISWLSEIMEECLRVIKPGGMAVIWAIPRTSHWTATALEDAGFEIREKFYHIFGSGFPKSASISKNIDKKLGKERKIIGKREHPTLKDKSKVDRQNSTQYHAPNPIADEWELTEPNSGEAKLFDGYGTATKPAVEEWILAMKPNDGTFAENAIKHGVAGINIDSSRIGTKENCGRPQGTMPQPMDWGNKSKEGEIFKTDGHSKGRWPANLILQHHPECVQVGTKKVKGIRGGNSTNIGGYGATHVDEAKIGKSCGYADKDGNETIEDWECHEQCPIQIIGEQSGVKKSGAMKHTVGAYSGESNTGLLRGRSGPANQHGDKGTAARFFLNLPPENPGFLYQSKPSRSERDHGCKEITTWENVDLNQDLMELKELLKGISEDGLRKINDNEWSMMLFGKNITEISQKDMMFIISMALKMIIALKTLSCSQNLNIKDYTQGVTRMIMENGLNLAKSVECINWLKQNTTNESMEFLLGAVVAVLKMLIKIIEKGRKGNIHSTVKSLALMKYLVKLAAPPQDPIILDLFAGSGTTGVACEQLKIPYILIEREEEYCEIIKARIKAAHKPIRKGKVVKRQEPVQDGLLPYDVVKKMMETEI